VISLTQRSLYDNTQHSQETNIHAPCEIQTRNPSKQAAADQRLRPHGHRDWPTNMLLTVNAEIPIQK